MRLGLGMGMGAGGGAIPIPDIPTATAATLVTDVSFTANWSAATGADSYRLDVSEVSNFATFVSGYEDKTVAGTSDSVTGLTAGTTYYYRVRAVNAGGPSASSETISIMLLAAFNITGTGATESTLSLFFPTSENGKIITATGSVKFGASGDQTTQVITGNATNTIKVWCPNGQTGKILLPNTYTRFSANTSDKTATNGWATQTGSPSISFDIAILPAALITFHCYGSNTISGSLPSDWKSMTYFACYGSNTISGSLPSDWKSMTTFVCSGTNTISGSLPSDWKSMIDFYCTGSNGVSGSLPSDWKSMTNFVCTGSNTVNGIAAGGDAFTATSMAQIYLDPTTGGGLTVSEQSRILILMGTKTSWTGSKSIGFYAPCASMADTAADGIWDYTTVPTPALAAAVKTLVRTKGVTITLVGVNFTTGSGLPTGFVDWLTS